MVLLVIDTQKLITNDRLYAFERFEKNIKQLIDTARKNQIEVIYVRHDDGEGEELTKGTPGYDVYEGFAPNPGERIFDKNCNSAFKESGLLEYLRDKGEKQIIITGIATDFCIDACVKCGFEHGFEIVVPQYANTTNSNPYFTGEESYRFYNEYMWPNRYASCISMEDTIHRMESKDK